MIKDANKIYKERKLKLYVCTEDWYSELGQEMAKPDVVMYPSVKSLKKHRTCWEECGIVELEVKLARTIVKPMPLKEIVKRAIDRENKK